MKSSPHECSFWLWFDLLFSLVKSTHLGTDLDTTLALDELHGLLVGLWEHLVVSFSKIKAEVEL